MKKQMLCGVAEHISDNKHYYAVVIAALFAGLVLGSVSAASMEGEQYTNLSGFMDNFISSYNLQPVNKTRVLMNSIAGNIKTVLFLWVSGMWVGLIPFAIFQMGVKGYKLGFSAAFLVSAYKGRGILFAVMSLMPQILILMPILTVYTVFNIKYAMSVRKMRLRNASDTVRRDMYIRNFLCVLGVVAVVFVCSLFDAFVIPPVLKPVCSYLAS